jgi:hypothetical protein
MITHWETAATLAAQHQDELRRPADRHRQAAGGERRRRRWRLKAGLR